MAASKSLGWIKWILLLAVLAGGWFGFQRWRSNSAGPGVVSFKTNAVVKGDVVQVVTANGALNPVRVVTVGSQISGIITELNADFNSRVQQGQVLARIDPATYERAMARAEADLANAQAGLEFARFNARRAKELYTGRLISETEYQQAEVSLLQADANVKIRQASVDTAKVDLDRTVITAPIGGMVISRRVEAGQTVAASFNAPELFQIADDLTKMQIETAVSEADIGGVEEGQKVNFVVDAFPGRQFRGKVRQVRFAAVTNQNVVTYAAVVDVDNADLRLRPGMTANASIITAERTGVLKIPNAALRFRPPPSAVVASTNDAVAKAAGVRPGAGGSDELPTPPWMAERRRPTDEERQKYEASLTPAQQEQYRQMRERMRAMMAQRNAGGEGGGPGAPGGAGGGGFGGGRGGSPASDGPGIRTVYRLDPQRSTPDKPVLEAVSIRTGISDGSSSEVIEGLSEGDVIISGLNVAEAASAGSTPGNPFMPFGGRRR